MSKKRWTITAAFAGTSMLALATAQAQGGATSGSGSVGGVGQSGVPTDTTTTTPAPTPTPVQPPDSTRTKRTNSNRTGTTGTEGTSGTDPMRTTPSPADTSGTTGIGGTAPAGTTGSSPGGTSGSSSDVTGVPRSDAADTNVDLAAPPPAEPVPPFEVVPPPFAAPVQPIATDTTPRPTMFNRVGGALLVGGGVEDFTYGNVQSMTGVGGYWNARAIAGTRQLVGLEAAYIGAAHRIDALGLSSNAALVSNGVEGALRLNAPILGDRSLVEPFGFVGLGWSHYSLANTNTASSDVNDNDDVMTLPYGGGLEFAYGPFMADARFTYRYTYRNDLMRTSAGRLNNWNLGGQVGFAF